MHTTLHPLSMAGLALIAVALLIYLVAIIAAMLRMRRQYSSAMSGMVSLRIGAAFSAAARLWPLAIVIAIGVGLFLLGR
jgi:integral membrane sensor domain MASE1